MITSDDVKLKIDRIPRLHIDKFFRDNPKPQPPLTTQKVWGGVEEEVYDYEDRDYQQAMYAYNLQLGQQQFELICPAIEIVNRVQLVESEIDEIKELGILGNDSGDIRYILRDRNDLVTVVETIFYNSTVTAKGIEEAINFFGLQWMGLPIMGASWKTPGLPVSLGNDYDPFGHRQAGQASGYAWNEFGDLTGYEQSECVAYFMIKNRLDWLSHELKSKTK